MIKYRIYFVFIFSFYSFCLIAQPKDNVLSKQEKKEGWKLLFNGRNTKGWRNFNSNAIGKQWIVEESALKLEGKGGGDIVTENDYQDFELQLDWKISDGGNSGIFFHVLEGPEYQSVWKTGPEMQILDDDKHKDAANPTHRAGCNYDFHEVSKKTVKPVGEWNHVLLVVNKDKVSHYLNNELVVEYVLGSKEWEELYQKSKFSKLPMYGRGKKGKIALQDHGDVVWFKNIKIKSL